MSVGRRDEQDGWQGVFIQAADDIGEAGMPGEFSQRLGGCDKGDVCNLGPLLQRTGELLRGRFRNLLLEKHRQAGLAVPAAAEPVQVVQEHVESRRQRQRDTDDGRRHQAGHPVAAQPTEALQRHLGMAS